MKQMQDERKEDSPEKLNQSGSGSTEKEQLTEHCYVLIKKSFMNRAQLEQLFRKLEGFDDLIQIQNSQNIYAKF